MAPQPDPSERRPGAGALGHVRICDLSGQLAGAGSTRYLAAVGAQVIRVEDPVNEGRWDIIRGAPPLMEGASGIDGGGGFNNHNVEKLGVTINLRDERGRDLLRRLVETSDVLTENFSAGVMDRLGFGYAAVKAMNPRIVYVSNSGFGKAGPYATYKTFGPIVQACSGLTFASGLPDLPPAGWGFSYMDHMGANFMALAVLGGLVQRARTGETVFVDMSCTDAGLSLAGPELLDFTANGRPMRRPGSPDSNHVSYPAMAPHGIYPASGEDAWVAIACRDDDQWSRLAGVIDEPWVKEVVLGRLEGRAARRDEIEERVAAWTTTRDPLWLQETLGEAGVPAAKVASPEDRIEHDAATSQWGLWPWVTHSEWGRVRVDGIPVHFSRTDWSIERGAPCLGEHNRFVFGDLLGLEGDEIARLSEAGVI